MNLNRVGILWGGNTVEEGPFRLINTMIQGLIADSHEELIRLLITSARAI